MTAQELWNKEQQMALDYQKINNTLICSPEEISYNLKLITRDKILSDIKDNKNSDYYLNLKKVIN